jgi:hypothetical protein
LRKHAQVSSSSPTNTETHPEQELEEETYDSVKRDLPQCKKRPTVSKETYKH